MTFLNMIVLLKKSSQKDSFKRVDAFASYDNAAWQTLISPYCNFLKIEKTQHLIALKGFKAIKSIFL